MQRSGSNQERAAAAALQQTAISNKPEDGAPSGIKGSPVASFRRSSSGLLLLSPGRMEGGSASTTWQAVGVFVTLLVLLQAMSYSFRVWQGDSLPQHRRRSWHDREFHSYYQGGSSGERLSGPFNAEPPGIAEIIHEEVDELSATLEQLMHDPALQMELEPGQGDLDLDVGMDPRQMPLGHEGEGGEWAVEGEGEEGEGGASEPWADMGLSGAHSDAETLRAGGPGAASLARDPGGWQQQEELKAAVGGGGVGRGEEGGGYEEVQQQQQQEEEEEDTRGVQEEPPVAAGSDQRVAVAAEEKKAVKEAGTLPARVVTKQQQPSKPQQPQAKAAKPPKQQEEPKEPKEKPIIKPSRPRPGSHASRIAKIVERLYRDKKVYNTFTGHVAMSRATLPPVGRDIRTPWKMIPKGNWRTLGKVTQNLLHVLPATDVVGSKHYKTCAVVGSAGILLTQDYGHEIDKHDCVIRFNIAPTKGFEAGVGAKTTLRFVNRLHFGFRETPNESILQHVTMPDMMAKYINMMKKNPKMPTYPFDMSFYEQMIDWHRVQQPTNGYFGMKLALHLCDRIDVYGFVRNWRGNFKYHYFNAEEPNAQQFARDKQGELPLIQELMETHKQRMFFMHPCILDSKCEGCPSVAKCVADVPYAVPKPGYCRSKGSNCWLKCDSCPGGKKNVLCPADVSGGCVQ